MVTNIYMDIDFLLIGTHRKFTKVLPERAELVQFAGYQLFSDRS